MDDSDGNNAIVGWSERYESYYLINLHLNDMCKLISWDAARACQLLFQAYECFRKFQTFQLTY